MLKNKKRNGKIRIYRKFCIAVNIFLLCCILFAACNTGGGNKETERKNEDERETEKASASPEPTETPLPFAPGTFLNGNSISGMDYEEAMELAEKLRLEAQENYECTLVIGENEYRLTSDDMEIASNAETLLEQAMNEGGGEYELKFAPADTSALREKLQSISDGIETFPVAPEIKINKAKSYENIPRFLKTGACQGSELDIDGTVEKITAGEKSFSPPMIKTEYAGKAADGLPQLLSSFVTSFNAGGLNSKGRVHNLKKASEIINGTVVAPGENFSCSTVLGERSEKNGWAPAPAFSNGGLETVDTYGGGICQISTTMYNAVLKADLKVIARRAHTKKVRYVEGGMDAAISGNDIDFIWKNNTAANVYVFMWVKNADNTLHCELYGKIPERDFDEIIIKSEFVRTVPPAEPEFTVDYSLKV